MGSGFCLIKQPEAHDCQNISWFTEMRDGSVQCDDAVIANRVDNVRFKPFAVRSISDQDSLILFEFNQLGKVSRDAQTAFVIHVRPSDNGSMNLRFEKRQVHLLAN
jgi:hypothetical protein